jgi:nucleolar GTP-binding protein
MLVINKIDVTRLEDLTPDNRALVQEIIDSEGVSYVQVSCYSDDGVMELKNKACDTLLAHRVDNKLKGSKINAIANRIHVAQPKQRDDVVRAPFIPDAVKERKKHDKEDPEKRRLLKDREAEEGGAGVFNINMKSTFIACCADHFTKIITEDYLLANPEWKMDAIPEIMDGKNVADFIDPDIAEKLEALEREEERLEAEGFYDSDEELVRMFHSLLRLLLNKPPPFAIVRL